MSLPTVTNKRMIVNMKLPGEQSLMLYLFYTTAIISSFNDTAIVENKTETTL